MIVILRKLSNLSNWFWKIICYNTIKIELKLSQEEDDLLYYAILRYLYENLLKTEKEINNLCEEQKNNQKFLKDFDDIYSVYFLSKDTGFAVGLLGRIIKTTNSCATWKPYSPTYFPITSVFFPTADTPCLCAHCASSYWHYAERNPNTAH